MIMEHKRVRLVVCAVFVVVEAALGVCLQCASGDAVRLSSYAAVVLACLFCFLFAKKQSSYFFTQAALLCTVGADYFLVYSREVRQLPAMIFFLFVQGFYFLRLYTEDAQGMRRTVHVYVRLGLTGLSLLLTVLVLGDKADAVALVSMAYYANLILNIVFSFLQNGARSLFSWGLVLFVLCDTVVGLSCLDPYLTISEASFLWALIHPGFNLAWVFYLPSQVLLAMSLIGTGKNQKERSAMS